MSAECNLLLHLACCNHMASDTQMEFHQASYRDRDYAVLSTPSVVEFHGLAGAILPRKCYRRS